MPFIRRFVGAIGKNLINAGCKTMLRKINAHIVLKGSTSGERAKEFVDGIVTKQDDAPKSHLPRTS